MEDLISEITKLFERFNRARNYILFQQYMKGENLLMHRLMENGGESTPSDLAFELGFSSPRVAAMLSSLELKKLVKRTVSPTDKRKTLVKITPKGEEWAALANEEVLGIVNGFLDRLGEEDAKEFVRIMKKMLCVEESASGEESRGLSADTAVKQTANR